MFHCVSWHCPLNSDGPVLLYPCLLGAAAAEAAEDVQGVGLFCTKLCGPCKSFSVWVNVKGDGRKRAHGKRSPPSLCSALLAPFACKTYCDSVSQSVKLLRLPLDSGGCNAADPFPFFFVLRVWARTSVSASSSTIPCCWSWPSRTWCSTTRCEAADRGSLGSRPWGGVVGCNLNTAAQNPVRIHTHSGLTASWVCFLKVEPLWQ